MNTLETHRPVTAGTLVVLALWVGLPCLAPGQDESQTPPVAAGTDPIQEFLKEKFEEAQQHFDQGRYYSAFRMADAILVLSPDVAFRDAVRRLRRRAEAHYLGEHVVSVTFVLDPERNTFPVDHIFGFLVIENVSQDKVQIGELQKGGVFGRAVYEIIEVFADGSEVKNQGSRVIRSDAGFELEPAGDRRIPVEFEVTRSRGVPVVSALLLDGTLRPPLLRVADRTVSRGIPWQSSFSVVLPEDLADIPQDPYRHVQRALLERDPRRFVASTRLWRQRLKEGGELAHPLKESTIDLLLESLSPAQELLDRLIMRELEALTGVRRPPRVESWRVWGMQWRRERARR